ncbi:hypothetical protein ACFQX4_17950 [Roseomonas sp. GCM10028921]
MVLPHLAVAAVWGVVALSASSPLRTCAALAALTWVLAAIVQ